MIKFYSNDSCVKNINGYNRVAIFIVYWIEWLTFPSFSTVIIMNAFQHSWKPLNETALKDTQNGQDRTAQSYERMLAHPKLHVSDMYMRLFIISYEAKLFISDVTI